MIKINFAKKSSKVNYMLSTIVKSLNITARLNQDFKDKMKRELQLLNKIENQNLLEDLIIENKVIYGGYTKV